MKHTLKITLIILSMFIITQLIGLYVVNFYLNSENTIPYGFDEQKTIEKTPEFYAQFFTSLIGSFAIAVFLVFLLMKIKSLWFIRGWFFIVISMALGLTLNVPLSNLGIAYASLFALAIGLILAYIKIFRKNIIMHNLTELLVYPGIAAIFVGMLNIWTMVLLLVLISIYDMWAVWHTGVMMKMAKYQINTVGILGGFMLPYASKKMKNRIELLKLKYKNKQIPINAIKKSKIKVGLAILGGGDIIFPIIAAGVFFKTFGNIYATLIITFFVTIALALLLIFGDKKKAYPAMPYLTAGIFLGMIIGSLIA